MGPSRPSERSEFEIAIICALVIEADAVEALFDEDWDSDGYSYGKAPNDPNAYSTGSIGCYNVVLAHLPGMGTAHASATAASFRMSFPNIKLALVVGICGVAPVTLQHDEEIVLGDVIVSTAVVQYDLGRQLLDQFKRKDTIGDSLGRPTHELRALMTKLQGLRSRRRVQAHLVYHLGVLQKESELAIEYPGRKLDRLFISDYTHTGDDLTCDECGCNGKTVPRKRLSSADPQPMIHFGQVASGNTVMRSGKHRDDIARREGVIAFEMEGAGVWDSFPCVVIKGACDYADSHKNKSWQKYAAATAASCAKAFLAEWMPSASAFPQQTRDSLAVASVPFQYQVCRFLVPFAENKQFVGREVILDRIKQGMFHGNGPRLTLVGLGGIGKSQVALQIAYHAKGLQDWSVAWLSALSMATFEQSCADMASMLSIPANEKEDAKEMVKRYLESTTSGQWLLIVDNADDEADMMEARGIYSHLPENINCRILFTTRSKDVAQAIPNNTVEELGDMSEEEAKDFLSTLLPLCRANNETITELARTLTCLPLAISQAAAYIKRNGIPVSNYLSLLRDVDKEAIDLLSREYPDHTRYRESRHAVATTWHVSFNQIRNTDKVAAELLFFLSQIESRAIPQSILPRTRTEESLLHAIGTLCGYAFLSRREDSEMLDMHSLVHLAARVWVSREGETDQIHQQAAAHLTKAFKTDAWEDRERWRTYMVHVLRILQVGGQARKWDANECDLAYWAGRCLMAESRHVDAVKLLERLVEVEETTLPQDDPRLVGSQYELGRAHLRNKQTQQAVKLLSHVEAILSSMHAVDDLGLLTTQQTLALALSNMGRHKDAVELLEHAIKHKKKALNESDPQLLHSQEVLSEVYWRMGQVEAANKSLEHIVRVLQETLHENHPDLLVSRNDLAVRYVHKGQFKQAIDLLEHVTRVWKSEVPETHAERLTSEHNLAHSYAEHGRPEEAIKLLEHVVKVRKIICAEDDESRLSSEYMLARSYMEIGRVEEAVELVEHVVEICEFVRPEDDPKRRRAEELLAELLARGEEQDEILGNRFLG
ncbi:hypothetical protein CC79DRAFT_1396815 [Sarocladium strictum]